MLCIIAAGGSIDGREAAVLNGAIFGGTNGTAARVDIDGLPVDVERTDEVSSTKFWANAGEGDLLVLTGGTSSLLVVVVLRAVLEREKGGGAL